MVSRHDRHEHIRCGREDDLRFRSRHDAADGLHLRLPQPARRRDRRPFCCRHANECVFFILYEYDAGIGHFGDEVLRHLGKRFLAFERRRQDFAAFHQIAHAVFRAPSLGKIHGQAKRFNRIVLCCHASNQNGNAAAILSDEFLFIRRENAVSSDFVTRVGIEQVIARRSDHFEKDIIGFRDDAALDNEHSNDVRFHETSKSFLTRAQRILEPAA